LIIRIFLVLVLFQASACSTIVTVSRHNSNSEVSLVYSGVKADWVPVSSPLDSAADSHLGLGFFLFYPFFVVDLVLSALADTLILPYTVFEGQPNDTQPGE